MDSIVIDESASTVFLSDPLLRLDVGAVAKGWSVEQVCKNAPEGLLVSVGGNVRATGPKPTGNPWVVGLQSPDGNADDYLHTLNLETGSVVTSGDYQRYYVVDGKPYHHIIDPETLYPADRWRAVSVVCPDSGLGGLPFHRPVHSSPGGGAGASGPDQRRGHVAACRRYAALQPRL